MKVLVITTRNLPKIPVNGVSEYVPVRSENLSRYVSENEGMPGDIRQYLHTYNCCTEEVSRNLEEYLEACGSECRMPILKRQAGSQLMIYVTLCLGNEYSGFGDGICHGYLNALMDDVISDTDRSKDEYHLLAHCTDIVQEYNRSGLSRPVSKDELKCEDLKDKLHQTDIYCHERNDRYYKNIITRISDISQLPGD